MIQGLEGCVLDDPGTGAFSVNRNVFTDEAIFALEMERIFEASWIFLGLETQLARPHDFLTARIGRQPVLVTRDGAGQLHGLMNSCRHRGALVAHKECGNLRYHACRYHGWTYDSAGVNVNIKDEKEGAYSASFRDQDHSLARIPRFETYRGMIFGSLNANVPALVDWLGEFRFWVDLILDHGDQGMEIVPGGATYYFDGNWKLQVENGMDFYHLTSAHPSFMGIVSRRNAGESANRAVTSPDFTTRKEKRAGMFAFEHGHSVIWVENPSPQDRPLWLSRDSLVQRVGPARAEWMLNSRNMTLFPGLQMADATATILRLIRPISVNRTEMRVWCIAPIGEPDEARLRRIRQFEDFFNPSGLATPDDNACYRDCQDGYQVRTFDWQQGYARGGELVRAGGNEVSEALGFRPRESQIGLFPVQNEVCFHASWREWRRLMLRDA